MTAAARYASVRARHDDDARKGWRSGFCGLTNPRDSHNRCPGVHPTGPCICACHQTPASEERTALPSVMAAAPAAAPRSPVPTSETECPCAPDAPPHEHGVGGYAGPTSGVFEDYPERAYHAHHALSNSGAKILATQTPAHFRYAMDHERPSKPHYDLGHGVHKLVLGIGAGIARLEFDTWRGNAVKAAAEEARAEGKVPLLAEVADQARAMADAVLSHPKAGALFVPDQGVSEVSLFWDDIETGVPRRARIDRLKTNGARPIVGDLKTTRNADPRAFGRSAAEYGYFQQHPFYLDGLEANGLAPPGEAGFVFVLVETAAPHLVSVVELHPDAVRLGRALNQRAIATFADCTARGEWPGYSSEIELVDLPSWHYSKVDREVWA